MGRKSVLVASKNRLAAETIGECLGKEYRVDYTEDRDGCFEMFRHKRREYTFIDLDVLESGTKSGRRTNYKEQFQPFWHVFPSAPIIVLSEAAQIREAVAAVKAGASTYLTYPIDAHELEYVLGSLYDSQQMESELLHLRENVLREAPLDGARTESPAMMEVLRKVKTVAATRTTVLLTGETGTGKGVMARLIHSYSNRSDGPFVDVHCGAIPDTLLESEFFGHEKGAFTGAIRRKPGKFQIGDKGTVFLDEIGTLTPSAQIKMLQVLQEKRFARVGGEEMIEVDVRLVTATNLDLKKRCRENLFREDLYYRLNVFPIEMIPLRERSEDIPLLVDIFLNRLNREHNKNIHGVSSEVMDVLRRYDWPGNVRELENLIERAYILERDAILCPESFPGELFSFESLTPRKSNDAPPTLEDVRRSALDQVERRYLREVLLMNKGRIDQTAAMAGVTTRQLHNLMNKYGLRKEEFK